VTDSSSLGAFGAADHLNTTADHLCLICLNTAHHRRWPQITDHRTITLTLALALTLTLTLTPTPTPTLILNPNVNRSSAVIRGVQTDQHRWSAVMFRWSVVICSHLRSSPVFRQTALATLSYLLIMSRQIRNIYVRRCWLFVWYSILLLLLAFGQFSGINSGLDRCEPLEAAGAWFS